MKDRSEAKKPDWYMLEPAKLAVQLIGKTPAEIAVWTVSLADALASRRSGIHIFADELMAERNRYIETRRKCGGMRGTNDQPEDKPRSSIGDLRSSGGEPRQDMTRQDTTLTLNPKSSDRAFKMDEGGNSQDKYERIHTVPQDQLADYAARKLQDANQTRAVFAYKRAIRIIGPEAFRSLLAQFIGEIAAEECGTVHKLGALFTTKFLKPAVEAKRSRGAT